MYWTATPRQSFVPPRASPGNTPTVEESEAPSSVSRSAPRTWTGSVGAPEEVWQNLGRRQTHNPGRRPIPSIMTRRAESTDAQLEARHSMSHMFGAKSGCCSHAAALGPASEGRSCTGIVHRYKMCRDVLCVPRPLQGTCRWRLQPSAIGVARDANAMGPRVRPPRQPTSRRWPAPSQEALGVHSW